MITDIDPHMRYCLTCNDEYIPEMTKCGVCGAELVSGNEVLARRQAGRQRTASRKGPLTPDDDIVTIFKGALADIKRIEQQLRREQIGTLVWGDKPSCGKGCCGGGEMELRVRREDAAATMAIIEADFARQTASHHHHLHGAVADYVFDPQGSTNQCPACGCSFSTPSIGSQGLTCPDCGLCFG